ncbi:GNAT family N-acetyltransferase [uncultured Clostridium sp.]|uniref:GNAT family N-acetyltransferase n=2 Tax=Clostridium TaxID=1485 RepID=UPI00262917B0|nr:GNAT family N-acetyltransferase [uncultured Clostridium sp.]
MYFEIKMFNELTIDEMYEIAKSRFEVFVCEQEITEEQDFDDKDKVSYHVMLKDEGRIIAYSRIVPKKVAYENISIGRVLVLKGYRRKGIAQKMMKSALEFIKNNLNENVVVLSAQEYAKEMYLSVGFKVVSDIYDEVNIPHVKMKIEL